MPAVRICSLLFLACTVFTACDSGSSGSGSGGDSSGVEGDNSENSIDPIRVEQILAAADIFSFDETNPIFTDGSDADELSQRNGNTADTLGGQRLLAFKYALGVIATELRITQTIEIEFRDSAFTSCNPVATASYNRSWFNGIGQIPNVLYPTALSNQLSESDTSADAADVWIQFNQLHFDGNCDRSFYYGLAPSVDDPLARDFIHLVLHEMMHGFGFERRPSGATLPFIYEVLLWDRTSQSYFVELDAAAANIATATEQSIVFNGRYTRTLAPQLIDNAIAITADAEENLPLLRGNVINTVPIAGDGISGQISVLDFDTCQIDGSLTGKIALLPEGCAREELGLQGALFNSINEADRQGAIAVITSTALSARRAAHVEVGIPVLSMPLQDYRTLEQTAFASPDNSYSITEDTTMLAGSDSYGRPFVVTGSDVREFSSLLHVSPNVHPQPIDGETVRHLMDPIVARTGLERATRSLQTIMPMLLDIGWAASSCGNGRVDVFEECDTGSGGAECRANCMLPGVCGDGVVEPLTEACDAGFNNNDREPGACSSRCSINPVVAAARGN